jgi:hypothetical protein
MATDRLVKTNHYLPDMKDFLYLNEIPLSIIS